MRPIASFLLLGCALTAGAAEIWRWTDANGVVHYSDNPAPGAERISISAAPKPSGSGPPPEAPPQVAQREPQSRAFSYTSCAVSSPASDETFQGVQAIPVQLEVQPGMQAGHRVHVYVDGVRSTDWPEEALSHTFPEVFRGSHTLQARIVDAAGTVLCTTPPLTFHLRQPGLLSPGRARPAPGPPPGN